MIYVPQYKLQILFAEVLLSCHTEVKLVQLRQNTCWNLEVEKQISLNSFLVIFFCLTNHKKHKTVPLHGLG